MSEVAGLSGRLWPLHLKPYRDELLSSWLVRISRAYGVTANRFCTSIWGTSKFWSRDIDQGTVREILPVLAAKTATPPDRVLATTLKGYPGFLPNELVGPGRLPWWLASRVHSRPRLSPWLQYCPHCLQQDTDPYFRRAWRLAFVSICTQHGRRLLDRCPACGKPLNFHRLDAGAEAITLCYYCRFDLRRAQAPDLNSGMACEGLIRFQTLWVDGMEQGRCALPGPHPVNAKDYFLVLRHLSQLVTGKSRAQQSRQVFCQYLRHPYFEPHFPGPKRRAIEVLSVVDRFPVMRLLAGWLDQWPERFVMMCEQAELRSTELVRGLPIRPEWYVQAVRQVCVKP